MNTPCVAILLPSLNVRPYLDERLDSIFNQSFQDWTLWVLDGYSTDGSWNYLNKHAADRRCAHIWQEPPTGVYTAWNSLVQRSEGKYIYIATADDTMYPDCLVSAVEAMEQHPEIDLCTFKIDFINEQGEIIQSAWDRSVSVLLYERYLDKKHIRAGISEFFLHLILGTPYVSITSLLIRRSLFEKTGLFQTNIGPVGDREWEMRACLHTDVLYLPKKLATWRLRKGQATSRLNVPERADYFAVSEKCILDQYRSKLEAFVGHSIISLSEFALASPYDDRRLRLCDPTLTSVRRLGLALDLALKHPHHFFLELSYILLGKKYFRQRTVQRAQCLIDQLKLPAPNLLP